MTVNGHFAPVSADPPIKEQYEHGVQVIDEDKQFKCVPA
jgi:protein SEY1